MQLVQIGNSTSQAQYKRRSPPAADLFFSTGIVAAIVGTSVLGSYLWLSRTGALPIPATYITLRQSHAFIQFYGFIGAFILGFLLQAGPVVFRTDKRPQRGVAAVFGIYIAGVAVSLLGLREIGGTLVAASFLSGLILLLPLIIQASPETRKSIGFPCLVGIAGFAVTAFGKWEYAPFALFAFWTSVFPVVMGIAQQVMANLFQATILSGPIRAVILAMWFIAFALSWIYYYVSPQIFIWRCFALFTTSTIVLYIFGTKAYKTLSAKEVYGFGFGVAWTWAIIGSLILFFGPDVADFSLHIWGTGFAFTLIMNVSIRVIQAITNISVLSDRGVIWLLSIWQVVPLGRGILGIYAPLPQFSWLVSCIASGVVLWWGSAVAIAVFKHSKRKALTPPGCC